MSIGNNNRQMRLKIVIIRINYFIFGDDYSYNDLVL